MLKELPDKQRDTHIPTLNRNRKIAGTNASSLRKSSVQAWFGLGREGKLQIWRELMRLRQICCDPRNCTHDNYRGGSAKLETCMIW